MSAMEQSLRRALEAGDAEDPAFRESIYAASERALERMLAAKAAGPEAAHAQRVRLAETINRVEEDYFVATHAAEHAEPQGDSVWPEEAQGRQEDVGEAMPLAETRRDHRESSAIPIPDENGRSPRDQAQTALDEPERDLEGGASEPAPVRGVSAEPQETWSPGSAAQREETKAPKRGRMRPFVFGLVVLAFVFVAGLLFLYSTIFAPMDDAVSTSGSGAPVETIESLVAAEAGEAEWITLFDGTQLEMISTPSGGELSAISGSGERPAVRIAAASEEGEVDVSIGPGVVNGIKGRTVRVEITVGSADGTTREFGVRCLFGGDTVCGRQRFSTVQSAESFVFDMVVPSDPAASGTVAIDPSFGGGAENLDLYSVRLRTIPGV